VTAGAQVGAHVRSETALDPRHVSIAALVLLGLSGLAFWPPYLSRPQAADAHVHAHAALGAVWLMLVAVQPLLIRAVMRAQHRLLGRIGVVVGVAFAWSGVMVAHRSVVRMGADQFAREGRFVYLPLAMAVLFAVALMLAVRFRASPAVHSRFMAATLLPLLDPVIARLLFFHAPPLPAESLYQVPAFVLFAAVLARLAHSLPETATGRVAFGRYAIGTALVLLGFFVVPGTGAWLSFTAWWRGVPLT
jgi:hypothetical protein